MIRGQIGGHERAGVPSFYPHCHPLTLPLCPLIPAFSLFFTRILPLPFFLFSLPAATFLTEFSPLTIWFFLYQALLVFLFLLYFYDKIIYLELQRYT